MIREYLDIFLYFFIFTTIFFGILLIILFFKLSSLQKKFNNSIIGRHISETEILKKDLKDAQKEIQKINLTIDFVLNSLKSKVGTPVIKRYNPFGDTGGNQSFSLALLDEKGDGVIITSLFSREISKVFGKEIVAKNSSAQLSPEEVEILSGFLKK